MKTEIPKMPKVKIFSDGSVKGASEGPGGYGVIVKYLTDDDKLDRVMEYAEGFAVTTNNRMELMGAICGFESLKEPSEAILCSDSKYVIDAFNHKWIDNWMKNGWKTANGHDVKNVDLWKRLIAATNLHKCIFEWVKGHNGHPENERCDYLAQSSADGVKFERNEKGVLEPVTAKLSIDSGMTKEDCDDPVITLNSVVSEYAKEVAGDIKSYTTIINGAKFICDEEGNLSPHPDEDIEKCKSVFETLKKLYESDTFASLAKFLFSPGITKSQFDALTLFTKSNTIPKFSITYDSNEK